MSSCRWCIGTFLKKSVVPWRAEHCRKSGSADETHVPSQLSGGQQQRVAIARAIVTQPQVLFADEPTGNLDTATSAEIMKLLTGLNEQRGITIVMVTHEPDIVGWTRRIVRFRDGNIESDAGQRAGAGNCNVR